MTYHDVVALDGHALAGLFHVMTGAQVGMALPSMLNARAASHRPAVIRVYWLATASTSGSALASSEAFRAWWIGQVFGN